VTLIVLLPSSIGSKMRLGEEYRVTLLLFKGLDKSPHFEWEWVSAPLGCPPDEACNSESMVETMTPLEGLLLPF